MSTDDVFHEWDLSPTSNHVGQLALMSGRPISIRWSISTSASSTIRQFRSFNAAYDRKNFSGGGTSNIDYRKIMVCDINLGTHESVVAHSLPKLADIDVSWGLVYAGFVEYQFFGFALLRGPTWALNKSPQNSGVSIA
jgi:hypothetical protein